MITEAIPQKLQICTLFIHNQNDIDRIGNEEIQEKCQTIIGDILDPGESAIFIMTFALDTPNEGMAMNMYGPLPYDMIDYQPITNTKIPENLGEKIFSEQIPESAFDEKAEVELHPEEKLEILDYTAAEIALKI